MAAGEGRAADRRRDRQRRAVVLSRSGVGAAVDADLGAGDERAVVGGDHRDHRGDRARVAEDLVLVGRAAAESVSPTGLGRSPPASCRASTLANAVATPPGWMLTARRPCLEYSKASECVKASTPPLLAAYAAMYGCANDAAVEVKLTTHAPPGLEQRRAAPLASSGTCR